MIDSDPVDATPNPRRSDSGVSLPLVALMMVTLLGIAAFAVDLGWFYLSASKIQRAADASALAGVIHMPNDLTEASNVAHEIAQSNGYEDLELPSTYPRVDVSGVMFQPTQLRVTVTDQVPTFFLKVFGMSDQVITRSAQAEFVPPLPLGSPDNQFGNSCDPREPGCTNQPNFWANIHGKYTDTGMGDAFSSYCSGTSGSAGCTDNPSFRDRGYLYGITAPTGQSFSVEFMDMAFHNTSATPLVNTHDNHRTGDRGCEAGAWGNSTNASCGQTVIATLYEPDLTPLDISTNNPICTHTFTPQPQVAADAPYNWQTPGSGGLPSCFNVTSALAGTYVLQIRVEEPSQASYSGLNRYALRVTPAAARRLFGLGDVSLYNNFTGSSSEFYLAEVSGIYQGKTFVIELYDPGDAEDNASNIIQIVGPDGTVFPTCEAKVRDTVDDAWAPLNTLGNGPNPSPCQINATRPANDFDAKWLQITIDLPPTYSCVSCWWKVRYNYAGTTNDTTTWRAYILGNPIHLVPVS